MVVRKSSTLVLAGQIYSTSGVVSVGLRPYSRPVKHLFDCLSGFKKG